jgi:hypothetical protein
MATVDDNKDTRNHPGYIIFTMVTSNSATHRILGACGNGIWGAPIKRNLLNDDKYYI